MHLCATTATSSSPALARPCCSHPQQLPHHSSRAAGQVCRTGRFEATQQTAAAHDAAAQQLAAAYESNELQVLIPLEPAAPAASSGFGGGKLVGVLAAAALLAGLAFSRAKRSSNDPFSDVNTIQLEELDPEIIAAARARRSQERANFKMDLADVELPDNHPWATRKPVSAEQEAAIQARLQARPRRAAATDMRPGGARPAARQQQQQRGRE